MKKTIGALVFALLAYLSTPASAADKTWYGGSAAWSNPNAWTPAGVPEPSQEIEIPSGTVILDVPVTISNLLIWSGGTIQSGALRVAAAAVLRVTGDNAKSLVAATLANAGRIEVGGSGPLSFVVTGYSQSVWLTNESLGTIEWGGTVNIAQSNPGYSTSLGLVNDGRLRKTGGATNGLVSIPLYNGGTVEVQAGLLTHSGGGTSSGRFQVADGAGIDLQTGVYNCQGSLWEGPGPARIQGSATLNGSFTATNFGLAGGDLAGSFDVTGAFRWTGGRIVAALEQPQQILDVVSRFPDQRRLGEAYGLRHVFCIALAAEQKPFALLIMASRAALPPALGDIELVPLLARETESVFVRLGAEQMMLVNIHDWSGIDHVSQCGVHGSRRVYWL